MNKNQAAAKAIYGGFAAGLRDDEDDREYELYLACMKAHVS